MVVAIGRLSRISLISYYALEGLGNLELDSHDDEGSEVGGLASAYLVHGTNI